MPSLSICADTVKSIVDMYKCVNATFIFYVVVKSAVVSCRLDYVFEVVGLEECFQHWTNLEELL